MTAPHLEMIEGVSWRPLFHEELDVLERLSAARLEVAASGLVRSILMYFKGPSSQVRQ